LELARRIRIPALFCAFAVLVCELIARPYTTMGVCDDGPYILIAQKLAATGHIVYNGPTTPILGWQLYLAAAFIKLFGFSFTTVRLSTLLVAMALAFLLQRILVRASITERNATIATLALVLSPLYLMLSASFMTDITGLFAIVICLYGCLRALQASTSRAAIGWLCFAVATNALCGTSRQIGWLGLLVIVPSTLWLLRDQRRVFLAGAAANLAGALFVLACIHWFNHQPFNVHESLFVTSFSVGHSAGELIHSFLDAAFLIFPIMALFLPQIYKSRPRILASLSAFSVGYLLLAIHWRHSHPDFLLEPTQVNWVTAHGGLESLALNGLPPVFLHTSVQILLTILSVGGILGLIASFLRPRTTPPPVQSSTGITWPQLAILLGPFTLVYTLLLLPRAATAGLVDRYSLELLVVALICLVRYYQDQIRPRLPFATILLVAITAIYGIAVTHNLFSFYRARVAIAAELHAAGIPDTSVDSGWEYNYVVELQHADFINDPRMVLPANAYVPTPPPPAGNCPTNYYDTTPHIHAIYGISFDPNACHGPAPFTPVHYSRWLASTPGTLYVVRSTETSKP